MKRITIRGPVAPHTSYGQYMFAVAEMLRRADFKVSIRPTDTTCLFGATVPQLIKKDIVHTEQPEPWEILIGPPSQIPTKGKRTIFCTMFESTRLPDRYVQNVNRAELVIVPQEWQEISFSASGVTSKIAVLPLGIDGGEFRPIDGSRDRFAVKAFTFGCGGWVDNGVKRKGIDTIIRAFTEAFGNESDCKLTSEKEVVMRVKAMPGSKIDTLGNKRIFINDSYEVTMGGWYRSLDCFISVGKEGWGFMPHQAQACGIPLITTKYGAPPFCVPVSGYVPHTMVPAEEAWKDCGSWAEPDFDRLVHWLKIARTHIRDGFFKPEILKLPSWLSIAPDWVGLIDRTIAAESTPVGVTFSGETQKTFYHSGDLGDIIYSLPVIKEMGGGILYLGPDISDISQIKDIHLPREPINKAKFDFIRPLLMQQPYITDVIFSEKRIGTINLNRFRERLIGPDGDKETLLYANLRRWLSVEFDVDRSLYAKATCDKYTLEPWLHVPPNADMEPVDIILARSTRYNNPEFPWQQIRKSLNGLTSLFLGVDKEWMDCLCALQGVKTSELMKLSDVAADIGFRSDQAPTALAMAQRIASARLFIGNGSFPYAVAEAMKVPCVHEQVRPTTLLARPGLMINPKPEQLFDWPIKPYPERKIVRVVPQSTEMTVRDIIARESWKMGGSIRHIFVRNHGQWRSFNGSNKRMFLKDVMIEGITACQSSRDIVMIVNDDIESFGNPIGPIVKMIDQFGACCSFRSDYDAINPDVQIPSLGRDVFAFSVEWLKKHWDNIPDYLVGATDWDYYLAAYMRHALNLPVTQEDIQVVNPKIELETGYFRHKKHDSEWARPENIKTADYQVYNIGLTRKWFRQFKWNLATR